jgi:hypothetical protein
MAGLTSLSYASKIKSVGKGCPNPTSKRGEKRSPKGGHDFDVNPFETLSHILRRKFVITILPSVKTFLGFCVSLDPAN